MIELSREEAFNEWAEEYALSTEPLSIKGRRQDCLAAYEAGAKSERAVSDRLLEALKASADEIGYIAFKCERDTTTLQPARALIAEVEAMRKEKPE